MIKFIEFFKRSYQTDKKAFYAEIVETVLVALASAILSFTIVATAHANPYAYIFIPLYLMGSLLGIFSTYRRNSSALLLTTWFTIMNFWAFIQLFIL